MDTAVQEAGIKTFRGDDGAVKARVMSSVMDAIQIVTGCSKSVLTEHSELGLEEWIRVRNYLITYFLYSVSDITFKERIKRISIGEVLGKIQVQARI